MPTKISRIWQELKRRKVIRVITVYAAAAFVILELVDILAPSLRLPDWTLNLVLILLCVGMVIAIILSWIYDIHPEGGIVKTEPTNKVKPEDLPKSSNSWKIASYISFVVIAGLVLFHLLNTTRKVDWAELERTIGVLPFENLGEEDLFAVLNNTLPIALITELQNIDGFAVKPWLSTKDYSDTDQRSSMIGDELNVNFLVKGFLTPMGSEMEVDIWLINAASEEVIKSYNRKTGTSDILQVRRDISKQVASLFNNNFTPEANILTENPDAELAYFTGLNYFWGDETKEDFQLAINSFERAIQMDEAFSMAYVFLSSSNSWMYHFYHDRTEDRLTRAKSAFEKAYETDPGNPYNLIAEANYHYVIHEYETALEKFNRAAERLTENLELNLILGSLYRRQGKLEKALGSYLIAEELSPQNKIVALEISETNLLLRRYEVAEKYFQKYLLLGGRSNSMVNEICLYLLWKEDTEKSRQVLNARKELIEEKDNQMLAHYQIRIALIDKTYEEALDALLALGTDSVHNQFIFRPTALYYAEIYREQNNLELARQYYDSARIFLENKIAHISEDHRYHVALGMAYAGLGRTMDAVKEGQTAVELMPVTKDFYRGIFCLEELARIYTLVGDFEKATETLNQLLSVPSLVSVKLLEKEPTWRPLWQYPGFLQMIETHTRNQ